MKCIHRHKKSFSKEKGIVGRTCDAFPDGIPKNLYFGEILHNNILKGQKGNLIYSPKEQYIEFDKKAKEIRDNFDREVYLEKLKSKAAKLLYKEIKRNAKSLKIWDKSILIVKQEDNVLIFGNIVVMNDIESISFSSERLFSLLRSQIFDIIEFIKNQEVVNPVEAIKIEIYSNGEFDYTFE